MENYLPLFPLNVVLFPEMVLPLHIFEERYKEMIRECLRETDPFGVVYAHDEEMERVGCKALITKVAKEYDDGRMDIVTIGESRFEVVLFDSEKSFLRGVVTPYEDGDPPELPDSGEVGRLVPLYHEFCQFLNQPEEAENLGEQPGMENLVFRILSRLNVSNELKQKLLVIRSEKERVSTLLHYFELLLPRLRFAEQAAKRSRTNGNVYRIESSWKP